MYNNSGLLAIVNIVTSNNNSSINWVYKSEIFSVTENKLFHEKISEINQVSQVFEKIKGQIFDVEKGKSEKQDAVQTIKQVFGDEFVITYRSENNGVYGWQNGKRKGKTCRTFARNYLNKQYGRGNDKQS